MEPAPSPVVSSDGGGGVALMVALEVAMAVNEEAESLTEAELAEAMMAVEAMAVGEAIVATKTMVIVKTIAPIKSTVEAKKR